MRNTYSFDISKDNQVGRKYFVEVDGVFVYRENMSSYDSVYSFILEYDNSVHDFNECYGVYRIKIVSSLGSIICFSDNSGMMRFYINTSNHQFYHSLAEAENEVTKRDPNYSAIAQFLCYGCVYGNGTIIKTVELSDPNKFYIKENDAYCEKDKDLKEIAEYKSENISLRRLISQVASHCEGKMGCMITGGTDSRTVLANLISLGFQPNLAITGHDNQSDIVIAKKIADKVGLNLSVISDEIDDVNWLKNSIIAADGQNGICGIYRLYKLARFLQEIGVSIQFGGVDGEMYKNSFLNQDFPIYFGKPKWGRFYKYKVGTFDIDKGLFSKMMKEEIEEQTSAVMKWLKGHGGTNKVEAYLNAGYEIMQCRCNHVINMFEKHITIYNPLMERKMASYAYSKNPYKLEMQAFQRHEVSLHCENIKSIETDRHLSCDYNRRKVEFITSYLFLFRVALQRLLFRRRVDIRIDKCFDVGHKDEHYSYALKRTIELGILNKDIDIRKVPQGLADRLFTIGLFFDQRSINDY